MTSRPHQTSGCRWTLVWVVGMCCLAHIQAHPGEDVVAAFSDPLVSAWVAAAAASPSADQHAVAQSELPTERPGQGSPYNFCTLKTCATQVIVKAKDAPKPNNLAHGLLYMDLRYKPIPGVNSTMLTWMFENLSGKAVYRPTGKAYDMYLIFHPRDHVLHKVEKTNGRIGPGTNLTWCEMILSNCVYQKNSTTEPWVCPPTARGFLRSDPVAAWERKYQTKEVMVVNWFNSTGIEFSRLETNALLGNEPRVMATTRHTWEDNANGTALIRMRTRLWIGMMDVNTTDRFNTSGLANAAASFIAYKIMGDTSDLSSMNTTALGYMNALHFIEEYGGTRNWLPQIWRARNRPLPTGDSESGR